MTNMIYGTAWKKEETTRLVKLAITSGFRAIDTACQPKHYREDLVGDALKSLFEEGLKRDELFIQTKFTPISGQDTNNMPYLSSDDILTQLEKSFYTSKKNLNINFLDSYLIHSPFGPIEDLVKVYRTMEEFVQSGEVGQIGISNCYDIKLLIYLYDIAKIKPKVVQNRFYQESSYDKEIRNFCKQKDITYQSFWSLTGNPHLLKSAQIEELSTKYDKTPEQVLYKFLNQIDITPLNGTTSKTHMIEDLSIKSFSLESFEVDSISKLL